MDDPRTDNITRQDPTGLPKTITDIISSTRRRTDMLATAYCMFVRYHSRATDGHVFNTRDERKAALRQLLVEHQKDAPPENATEHDLVELIARYEDEVYLFDGELTIPLGHTPAATPLSGARRVLQRLASFLPFFWRRGHRLDASGRARGEITGERADPSRDVGRLDEWQTLPAATRAERRRLSVVGAAPVVKHPITPDEEDAARARCGGRPYYTIVVQEQETDLLCAVCHNLYWQCEHAQEIDLAYQADKKAGTIPSPRQDNQ